MIRYIYIIVKTYKERKKSLNSRNLSFLPCCIKDPDPESDPDPYLRLMSLYPGGQKTSGSGRSGFGSRALIILCGFVCFPNINPIYIVPFHF
jgi:hypothetical protein